MVLKRELNRTGDGGELSPIDRIDATLTRLADEGAERWQARTPINRQRLTAGLYVAAGLLGLACAALTRDLGYLTITVLAYVGGLPGKQRGSLVEEIQLEGAGLSRRTLKYLALVMIGAGLFALLSSLPFIVAGLLTGSGPGDDLPGALSGLALLVLKAADYIARTNPSDRGGDRERPVERIQSRVAAPMAA